MLPWIHLCLWDTGSSQRRSSGVMGYHLVNSKSPWYSGHPTATLNLSPEPHEAPSFSQPRMTVFLWDWAIWKFTAMSGKEIQQRKILWLGFSERIPAKEFWITTRILPASCACPPKPALSECWLARRYPCDEKLRGTWSIKPNIKTIKDYFAWLERWLTFIKSTCCSSWGLGIGSQSPYMWLTAPCNTATGDRTHFLGPVGTYMCKYLHTGKHTRTIN